MSGGGGGGGSKQPAPQYEPVEEAELRTTGYRGMGPTATPQTFTQQGMPPWMQLGNMGFGAVPGQQNWFAAPWWGRNAATGGQLSASDLMYQAPPAPAAAPRNPSKGFKDPRSQEPWRDEFGNTDAGRLMSHDYSGME